MFNRIVLAVDGTDASRSAARVAGDVAQKDAAEVVVLHVRDLYGLAVPGTSGEVDTFLRDVVDDLRTRGLHARLDVQDASHGHVGDAIADAAREEAADLVVMGSRRRPGPPAVLLGSVSRRVLSLAPCPVLVVH
jgi:nucleotide-binding universal stress UspA family protein